MAVPDLPNIKPKLLDLPTSDKLAPVGDMSHPPRILMLYGSLRERSFSRFLTEEAARILTHFGAEVRIFDPMELPMVGSVPEDHPKVQELRELCQWSEGQVWCSPERHGAITAVMKNQIDWIPLEQGAVRPSQGRTLAVMQVNHYTTDRLVAAANLFELTKTKVSSDVSAELAAACSACLERLDATPKCDDRDSLIQAFGRVGKPTMMKRVMARAGILDGHFVLPNLDQVLRQAVPEPGDYSSHDAREGEIRIHRLECGVRQQAEYALSTLVPAMLEANSAWVPGDIALLYRSLNEGAT